MTPRLSINRLVITKAGQRAYDQKLHGGLNIIHGANGSGKSSIADFIFFVLGGELGEWKEYALKCDSVVAEITATDTILTLRRDVSRESRRPMSIFFGPLDAALSTAQDGWQRFGFSRSDHEKSFSQVLFEALTIPEIPGDQGANITMHQILRLMYVDQSTPFQRIFRSEDFDPRETREAVAELMCGIGDHSLYSKRILLRALRRQEAEAASSLSELTRAIAAMGEALAGTALGDEVARLSTEKARLHEDIESVHTEVASSSAVAKEAEAKRRKVYEDSSRQRARIIELEQRHRALSYEIDDSDRFVAHLRELLEDFDQSAATYLALGDVRFEYCPACFSKLTEKPHGHCHLCGTELPEETRQSKLLALRIDIQGQINESVGLQSSRQQELNDIDRSLSVERRSLSFELRKLDELALASIDGRTAIVSEKSRQIGRIEARLEQLDKYVSLTAQLQELIAKKAEYGRRISTLAAEIESLEISQKNRRRTVLTNISERTKDVLRLDLSQHNDFEQLERFSYSFEDDWFAINGEPNITTSASGMVVVKNSLFIGILLASLRDEKMNFPRFLVLDNVEDKGMVGDRVRHFQKTMADLINPHKDRCQVIITTSTLNPTLDNPEYVVGPAYSKANRTLRIG